MTKKEQEKYLDKKPVAVFPMTNFGGVEIIEANDEFVIYRFNFGEPQELHRAKVRVGTKHTSFKTYAGYSIRLDDCMRV